MIDLDASIWESLRHAYGYGGVPLLIRQVKANPNSESWDALWSALCHQYDVYEATFAAIPHIVAWMGELARKDRIEAAHFIGISVVCSMRSSAPAIPEPVAASYQAALHEVDRLLLECFEYRAWCTEEFRILCGALAAVRGQAALAFDLFEAGSQRICPSCEEWVPPYSEDMFSE